MPSGSSLLLLHAGDVKSPSFTQVRGRRISSLMAYTDVVPPILPHAALCCTRSASPLVLPYLFVAAPSNSHLDQLPPPSHMT
jgi:hypothetical protein